MIKEMIKKIDQSLFMINTAKIGFIGFWFFILGVNYEASNWAFWELFMYFIALLLAMGLFWKLKEFKND